MSVGFLWCQVQSSEFQLNALWDHVSTARRSGCRSSSTGFPSKTSLKKRPHKINPDCKPYTLEMVTILIWPSLHTWIFHSHLMSPLSSSSGKIPSAFDKQHSLHMLNLGCMLITLLPPSLALPESMHKSQIYNIYIICVCLSYMHI